MWTQKEIESIEKHFQNGDINKIIEETGRTDAAIKVKAHRLNIYFLPKINVWFKKIPLSKRIYLAGHFDGEGCATFRLRKSRLTRTPFLQVNICNLPTLELYLKYFGGNIVESKSGTNKTMYRWYISKYENIFNFILSVIPYSIEKKEQLLLLKEFIDLALKQGKGLHFSDKFRMKAVELHERCTQLKKL
jgi:hypothetical protein